MLNYNRLITFLICLITSFQLFAQEYTNSQVIWNKSYSGNSQDDPHRVFESPDGNLLVAGITHSTQFDTITSIYEPSNIWLIYTNSEGEIIWHNTYGGNNHELPTEAFFHDNGDITIIGYSSSFDGDVENHHGNFENYDIWIFTINSNGQILRSNCIGTEANEFCNYATQTSDGGYLLACGKEVMKDDIIYETYIVKTDPFGNEEWSFQLDLDSYNVTEYVKEISENEFLIMGTTASNFSGQLHYSEEYGGYPDFYVCKVDKNGEILKSYYYGGTRLEHLSQVLETPDGGYLLLGQTESFDGDVTGYSYNELYCPTCPDLWVLKISENFEIEWEKAIGSFYEDYMGRGIINQNGNLALVGTIKCAFGGFDNKPPFPISYNSSEYPVYYGYQDAWLVEFSPDGEVLKNLILGAYHNERGTDIIETNTNEYVFCAIAAVENASENRWDISASDNFWIVKASLCYPTSVERNVIISECDSILIDNQYVKTSGTYYEAFSDAYGCDSLVITNLTVNELTKPNFANNLDTLTSVGAFSSYQWYDQDGIIEGATSNHYIIEHSGTYYLEVTNENGCSAMSEGMNLIATGIDDLDYSELNLIISPNPNDGRFNLQLENIDTGKYQMQIFNEFGGVILQKELNISTSFYDEEIDLSGYSKGVYFIRVSNKKTITTQKIIVN